jgi:hypothetical protein
VLLNKKTPQLAGFFYKTDARNLIPSQTRMAEAVRIMPQTMYARAVLVLNVTVRKKIAHEPPKKYQHSKRSPQGQ